MSSKKITNGQNGDIKYLNYNRIIISFKILLYQINTYLLRVIATNVKTDDATVQYAMKFDAIHSSTPKAQSELSI